MHLVVEWRPDDNARRPVRAAAIEYRLDNRRTDSEPVEHANAHGHRGADLGGEVPPELLVGVERRKIFTEGSILVGDQVTATAKGTFIAMQPGQFLDLIAERQARGEELR